MAAFSVAPSTSPSGCFSPVASMPRRDQDQVLLDVQADLDRQQVQRRQASQSFSFALDSATNWTADFEVPSPLAEATSPSGRRTERRNRRVES